MNKINNIEEFMNYYHNFHDSFLTNLDYDILNSRAEIFLDVCWSGKPVLNDDGTYQTNKTKIKMVLEGIEKCIIREIYSWDFINKAYMEYVKVDNKELICFASDEEAQLFSIICNNIQYEEVN